MEQKQIKIVITADAIRHGYLSVNPKKFIPDEFWAHNKDEFNKDPAKKKIEIRTDITDLVITDFCNHHHGGIRNFRKYYNKKQIKQGDTLLLTQISVGVYTIEKVNNLDSTVKFIREDNNKSVNTLKVEKISDQIKELTQFKATIHSYKVEETDNEITYQNEIEKAGAFCTPEEPQEKPNRINTISDLYNRKPAIAKEALIKAEYKCQLDPSHKTFISAYHGNNYVEAHHLIPLKYQDDFKYSLDVPGNIVSLCPNCHRLMHHAPIEERNKCAQLLFDFKEADLGKFGIKLTQELNDKYFA